MGRIPNHDLSCQTRGIWKTKCYYCNRTVYRVSCTCFSTAILNNNEPPWDTHNCIEKRNYNKAQNDIRIKEELRIKEIKDKYASKGYVRDKIILWNGIDSGNKITKNDILKLINKKILSSSDILYDNLYIKLEDDEHINGFCQEIFTVDNFKYKKELQFPDNDTIYAIMITEYNAHIKQFIGCQLLVSANEFKVQKIKVGSYCEIHFKLFVINEELFLKAISIQKYRKKLNYGGYEYVNLRK